MGKSAEAFRTISEAANELELPQHVLRFWETRFFQIKPLKRGGGRRYYRPDDVYLLKGIRHLLYDKGYTIKGVQRILKEEGVRRVISIGKSSDGDSAVAASGIEGDEKIAVAKGVTSSRQAAASSPGAPSSAGTSSPAKGPDENSRATLSSRGRARLTNVMRELLACKRLLDEARQSR